MNKLTKVIGALALIVGALPTPALADYSRGGGMKSTDCFRKVYREEYIPGTGASNPGRVRKYYERQRVACAQQGARQTYHHVDSLAASMIIVASKVVYLEGSQVGPQGGH